MFTRIGCKTGLSVDPLAAVGLRCWAGSAPAARAGASPLQARASQRGGFSCRGAGPPERRLPLSPGALVRRRSSCGAGTSLFRRHVGSSATRDRNGRHARQGGFLTTGPPRKPQRAWVLTLKKMRTILLQKIERLRSKA